VVSARELTGARVAIASWFLRFGNDRGRKNEGVKGEATWGWRGGLEGCCELTGGATIGIRPPRCTHVVARAYARLATEFIETLNRSRWIRLTGEF
jgi:hypothetical protein